MARKTDNKTWVYPSDRAFVALGDSSPALNEALELMAKIIADATEENAQCLSRAEWNLLADVLNSHSASPHDGGRGLAMCVRDGDRYEGLGKKWGVDCEVLAGRLSDMIDVRAWAVVCSVRHYWEHHREIDMHTDEWWTLAARMK